MNLASASECARTSVRECLFQLCTNMFSIDHVGFTAVRYEGLVFWHLALIFIQLLGMQPSAGTVFADLGGLADEFDSLYIPEDVATFCAHLTCDLCEKEEPIFGCHGCDARFCRTCCVRLHSDAIIEEHVLTRLASTNSNVLASEEHAVFKISGGLPSLDSKKMACLDVRTRLGQSLFALQSSASSAQSLESQIHECSICIARARCDAEDQARRDFEGMFSALSRRENQLLQHLQRLLQAKTGRLSDYLEEIDLRIQHVTDFLAAMNDPALNNFAALREPSIQLERLLAPSLDMALSDSLNDLLRSCKFEVDVEIGAALRSIHAIFSGRGQFKESDTSFAHLTPLANTTSRVHAAAKDSSLNDTKSTFAPAGSSGLSAGIGVREIDSVSRDVSTPYVKSGANGDRLILGGRPCTGPLMEQLLHTLRSHHNLTSIDVTSSALGDVGALALAGASLSCSHLCVLGMSQNNIGRSF